MKAKLEVVPHKVDSSIHAFYYTENYFDAPWHYHDEMELTYITQSSGVRYVGNSIENFQPGDMVLTGSRLPHSWKNAQNYTSGAASIYIQWKSEALAAVFNNVKEFHNVKTLLQKSNSGMFFYPSKKIHMLGNKLMGLPALSGVHRLMSFFEILIQLSEITDYKLLSEPGNHFYRYRETDNRIKDIFAHIDKNFGSKITVDDMAEVTFMTKSSFCKYFKNYFHKTFTEYLNEYRVHNVCRELQDTLNPISQIALESGYDNMSYFHRQFRKVTSLTPAAYRDKYNRGLI